MPIPKVILKAKRAQPFFGRHPWVFAGATERVEGAPADGDEVELVSHGGTFVARGLFNSRSKIQVRLYSWDEGVTLDRDFFRARLSRAVRLRHDVLKLNGPGAGYRVCFSESDYLSGMVVEMKAPSARYPNLKVGDHHSHRFGASGHWVAVTGLEGDPQKPSYYYVNDPDTGARLKMTPAELKSSADAQSGIWMINY